MVAGSGHVSLDISTGPFPPLVLHSVRHFPLPPCTTIRRSTIYTHTHNFIRHQRQQQLKKYKKTNKTKKKKRNKPLQDKSNTTGQHNSILGLIFSTQSTNDIIGYGELAQKIKFSITYTHRSGLPLRCTKFIEVDRLVPIFRFSFQQLGNVLGVE